MALRITSKDYENLYVTSYFSFHGDKNTLYVNSSKKYRPTSGKLCPRKKTFLPEKSSLQPEKKTILRLRKIKINSLREKAKKCLLEHFSFSRGKKKTLPFIMYENIGISLKNPVIFNLKKRSH